MAAWHGLEQAERAASLHRRQLQIREDVHHRVCKALGDPLHRRERPAPEDNRGLEEGNARESQAVRVACDAGGRVGGGKPAAFEHNKSLLKRGVFNPRLRTI